MHVGSLVFILVCFILDVSWACTERQDCNCRNTSGTMHLVCDVVENSHFDFATTTLENVTHVSVRGHSILMYRNMKVTEYLHLKSLILEGNVNETTLTGSFLSQFPNLETLRIRNCHIRGVERGLFRTFGSIRAMDLSKNGKIGFQSITDGFEGFRSKELRLLNLSSIHVEHVPEGVMPFALLDYLQNSHLENLDISWNRIFTLSSSFSHTPHLKYLNFSGTGLLGSFDCLSTINSLTNLVELILDFWPTTIRGYNIPEYPKPRYKHKRSDKCELVTPKLQDGCLLAPGRYLRTVQFQHSQIASLFIDLTNSACTASNHLVNLLMAHSTLQRSMNGIYGLNYLEVYDLSYPVFETDSLFPGVVQTAFIDMPSLQKLLIPGNRLYLMSEQELRTLFISCVELHLVDLSSNNLTTIPHDMFANNSFLSHINVSRNELESFTVSLYHLKNLDTLDLSNNKLKVLGQSFIVDTFWSINDVKLMLIYNRFKCDCGINDLVSLNASELSLTCKEGDIDRFVKTNVSTVPVTFICKDEKHSESKTLHAIVGSVCGLIVISIGIVAFCWSKKRQMTTESKNENKQEPYVHFVPISRNQRNERTPKFLAFIAYSHEDRDFVCNVLYPKLDSTLRHLMPEHDNNALLTLYDKHFLPGDDLDLICEEAIIQSYVTIAIVSQSFLESFWCSYEVKTALHANIPLIPIYLTKCDPSKLKGIFRMMFNHKVRMEWPDSSKDETSEAVNELVLRLGQAIYANIVAFKQHGSDDQGNNVNAEE